MDTKDFIEQLKLDGYSMVYRDVPSNSSLGEHDYDWAGMAMVTAGDFYVHTPAMQKTYRVGEVFSLLPNESHTESAGIYGAALLIR